MTGTPSHKDEILVSYSNCSVLHKMVRALEERERGWQKQFAEVEGCYYQMKSRYLMVLNHFKSPEKPSISGFAFEFMSDFTLDGACGSVMEPGMLQQLMAEVCRTAPRESDTVVRTDALGFYLKGRTEEASSRSSR